MPAPHSHVSKAAQSWRAAHLKNRKRAEDATASRENDHAAQKAATENAQRKENT